MPHARAKIVDRDGKTVPLGVRGELCMAGYQLQAGYWQDPEKTAETMMMDEDGTVWLRTGDEAVFDESGGCKITGRFKDIIIRGAFPLLVSCSPYIMLSFCPSIDIANLF
jgi:long-subunit acyl-CoA synthetase (AMP-forming)